MKGKEERTTVKDKDYLDVGKRENRKEILTKVKEVRKEMRDEKKIFDKERRKAWII